MFIRQPLMKFILTSFAFHVRGGALALVNCHRQSVISASTSPPPPQKKEKEKKKKKLCHKGAWKMFEDRVIDFNGMSTHRGLFYAKRLEDHIPYMFLFILFCEVVS